MSHPESPGAEFGRRFRAYARETGWPEHFEGLSMTKPPETGDIAVLAEGIDLNPKLRTPPWDRGAPCPVCSPAGPRWLRGGMLVWCAESRAIYCIGPTCGSTGWMRRISVALNDFRRASRERRSAARLAAEAALTPARIGWIKAARPVLEHAEDRQRAFAAELPRLRHVLYRRARAGDSIWETVDGVATSLGRIPGERFLTSTWRLAARLEEATEVFAALSGDAGEDAHGWAVALSPEACARRLEEVDLAAGVLAEAEGRVAIASAFLSGETVTTLVQIARAWRNGPNHFSISHMAGGFDIRAEDRVWRGPLNRIRPLTPPPSVDPATIE